MERSWILAARYRPNEMSHPRRAHSGRPQGPMPPICRLSCRAPICFISHPHLELSARMRMSFAEVNGVVGYIIEYGFSPSPGTPRRLSNVQVQFLGYFRVRTHCVVFLGAGCVLYFSRSCWVASRKNAFQFSFTVVMPLSSSGGIRKPPFRPCSRGRYHGPAMASTSDNYRFERKGRRS